VVGVAENASVCCLLPLLCTAVKNDCSQSCCSWTL